jgi:hypothetical protein
MHPIEPTRWDDVVLAVLLLIIGVPRTVIAIVHDRPIEAEGAVSMACVLLALLILLWRNWKRPSARARSDSTAENDNRADS